MATDRKSRRWAKALVGVLLLTCVGFLVLIPFRRDVEFHIGDTTISLRFQSLGASGRFSEDGLLVHDSWSSPGSFSSGRMYGLNFGSHLLRLDIIDDPVTAAQMRLPGTLDGLIKAATSKDRWLRFCAHKELASMGASAQAALPALARASEKGDWEAQETLLAVSKATGASAVPVLTNVLESPNPAMREKTAEILGEIGADAKEAVPALQSRLHDREPRVRLQSAYSIWRVDGKTHGCVAVVVPLLSNTGCEIRAGAAAVLGEFGSESAPAVPALEQTLQDTNGQVRGMCARALGMIGPSARSAIPLLIARLSDEDPIVLLWTTEALRQFGEDASDAIPKLTELAMRDDSSARDSIGALGTMGTNAAPALARIYRHAKRNRSFAAKSLIELGPRASAALPTLLEELDGDHAGRVRLAAQVVGHLGESARVALPRLKELLATDDERLRVRVAGALWRLDRQTNTVLRVLTDVLRNDATELSGAKRLAAEELAEMGPAASEAAPLLQPLLNGPGSSLRQAAVKALNVITSP